MKRSILFVALTAAALVAHAAPTAEKNGILVSPDGKTLYTFAKDTAGKSNCNDGCAAAWPPFTVANAALAGGDYSIVTREDGTRQWAYKGMPLYFYAGDAKPGDTNGEGKGGVWSTVKPQAKAAKAGGGEMHSGGYGYTY